MIENKIKTLLEQHKIFGKKKDSITEELCDLLRVSSRNTSIAFFTGLMVGMLLMLIASYIAFL